MKKTKRTLTVVLLSLLTAALMFGCTKPEKTIDVPDAPSTPISLTSANFVEKLTEYCHSGATFVLAEDIELSGEWTPIGRTVSTSFNGTLDGNGKTIRGLKTTGWDYDGTPITIVKRILGWKADGTPVYSSSKVVDMKTQDTAGHNEVLSIVHEGDNADPDYQDMVENGVIEKKTSYGSMGLFGYTSGATIKNLKVEGADFEFYGEGDNVYAGIISGCDIASDFTEIDLIDCKIKVSSIDESVVEYYPENARPSSVKRENNTKQYLGGIVGYSRGNALVSETAVSYKPTRFTDVNVNNIDIGNHNYSAFFDSRLDVPNADQSAGVSTSILATELTAEENFGFYSVDYDPDRVTQAFIGGISAYSVGAEMKNVSVVEFNKNGTRIAGKKLNVGGLTAALLGAESKAENVSVSAARFVGYDVDISAMIGGAFGEVKSASVFGSATVGNVDISAEGFGKMKSACIGGFAAYEDEDATLTDITVTDLSVISDYIDTGKLGSVMAGIVGVLRDSSLNKATVKNARFEILNHDVKEEYYCFTRNAVAQVYGNAKLGNEIKAVACKYRLDEEDKEYTVTAPVFAKNNYVNEDGESSVRLYYTVDGKQAGVYVTVFGDLVPLMAETGFRLRKETVWVTLTEYPDDFWGNAGHTTVKADGTYYYYYTNSATGEHHWNNIHSNASEDAMTYKSNRLYGLPKTMYRVELPENMIGTGMSEMTYYTYDEATGTLTEWESGVYERNKTYYVDYADISVGAYEIDITVYTESDKKIVVTKGKTEDDDVLAEATYSIAKSVVDAAAITADDIYGNVYQLCPAEMFLNVFFRTGTGFIADKNGFVITDADGGANRDFTKYQLVTGRPNAGSIVIEYKSVE